MSRLRLYHALWAGFLWACLLPGPSSAQSDRQRTSVELNLVTEDNPPFQFQNLATKQLSGISVRVIAELFKRAEVPYNIKIFPWARSFEMALTKKNHAVFGTIKTKEREDKFAWIGPISSSRWVLFAKTDSKIEITKLEDAKKYVIGGYINDAKSTFLMNHGLRVEMVNQNDINVKKLQKGRIDLWAAGSSSGRAIAAKQKQVFKEVFVFRKIDGFLAVNKNSDKATIKKLQAEIATMNQEGKITRIVESYFNDNQ